MSFWHDPKQLFPKQSHRWILRIGDDQTYNSLPVFIAKSVDRPSYEIPSKEYKYLYSSRLNYPTRLKWKPIKIEFYDAAWSGKLSYINYEDEIIKKTEAKEPNFTYEVHRQKKYMVNPENLKYLNYKILGRYQPSTQGYLSAQLLNLAGYNTVSDESTIGININNYTFKNNLIDALLVNDNTNNSKPNFITIDEIDSFGKVIQRYKIYNPLLSSVNFNKLDYTNDNILTITTDITYDWAETISTTGISDTIEDGIPTQDIINFPVDNKNYILQELKDYKAYLEGLIEEILQQKLELDQQADLYQDLLNQDEDIINGSINGKDNKYFLKMQFYYDKFNEILKKEDNLASKLDYLENILLNLLLLIDRYPEKKVG